MDEDNLLSLVKKLISIPSVYYQENDIIDFCNLWLSNKDLNPKVMNYNETKVIGYSGKNIICVVDSGKPGITVMMKKEIIIPG